MIPKNMILSEDLIVKKHSVKLYGHATSVTLEPIFWEQLKKIAKKQGMSLKKVIENIDSAHPPNLSSALRVYVLKKLLLENN
jgi:predicted DNA-binding ribbon-helix-helix protein